MIKPVILVANDDSAENSGAQSTGFIYNAVIKEAVETPEEMYAEEEPQETPTPSLVSASVIPVAYGNSVNVGLGAQVRQGARGSAASGGHGRGRLGRRAGGGGDGAGGRRACAASAQGRRRGAGGGKRHGAQEKAAKKGASGGKRRPQGQGQ